MGEIVNKLNMTQMHSTVKDLLRIFHTKIEQFTSAIDERDTYIEQLKNEQKDLKTKYVAQYIDQLKESDATRQCVTKKKDSAHMNMHSYAISALTYSSKKGNILNGLDLLSPTSPLELKGHLRPKSIIVPSPQQMIDDAPSSTPEGTPLNIDTPYNQTLHVQTSDGSPSKTLK